jgi:benzoyl-CoA reductase/2-hydroxyglutaryl-CoA dehydratase subunit BcrC/BadD/HgdB
MLKEGRERELLNTWKTTVDLGKFVLGYEDINSLDQWGGREVLREALPDEYRENFEIIQPDLIDTILKPKNRRVALAYCNSLGEYIDFINRKLDEGKKAVYYYFPMSIEILLALDMLPICYEFLGGISAAHYVHGCENGIDRIQSEGYPDHLCATQKGTSGYLLMGTVPEPDVLLKASFGCDPSNKMYEWASVTFDAPLITFEMPYYHNERAFRFFVGEVKRMIKQLEKISGNSLDEEKLREQTKIANQAVEYLLKIQELRKQIPCPDPGWHRPIDTAFASLLGKPEAVSYFKAVYEDAKKRVEKGDRILPEEKKETRCAWGYTWQAFSLPFFDWLEEEHGATYLECGLTYFPPFTGLVDITSLDTMIEGIAWRWFCWPMARQSASFSDVWVNDFVRICRDFNADCLVLGGHMACKHFWALNKLLSDHVKEEVGIPTLRFEQDIFDGRFTPVTELKRIMKTFFATL